MPPVTIEPVDFGAISLYGTTVRTESNHAPKNWRLPCELPLGQDPVAICLRDLDGLKRMPRDRDGSGGPSPNRRSHDLARKVLYAIDDAQVSPSGLRPCADGGVTITFFRAHCMALIECFNSGECVVGFSRGPGSTDVEDFGPDEDDIQRIVGELRDRLG